MSLPLPQLVRDDSWLAPYASRIRSRMTRLSNALGDIRDLHGGLGDFTLLHQETGVNFHPERNCWTAREWAPAAHEVNLMGDFNEWSTVNHPLKKDPDGYWSLELPGHALAHRQLVKLHVLGADGSRHDRIPATIRRAVQDPGTHGYAGQIWEPGSYQWLHEFDPSIITSPTIYESHVGMAGEEPRVHSYHEFAREVLPRIAAAGYNTVQLMAVAEHPYYGSFGYHVSSFFAPCSRFGTPEDLKHLVDTAHGLGLAVLMDVVHSHAIKNYGEGLNNFDGSGGQYFHSDERGDHPGWDSKCFDYAKPEVQRFLLSNLRYWLEEFRFDGFRFDGITSLLYWHRGTASFENYEPYFDKEVDEDGLLYLQLANAVVQEFRLGAISIAEDMSGQPGLCRPLSEGGSGFTHRLAMGIPDHWIKILKEQRDEEWDLSWLWDVLTNRRAGESNIAYTESHDQALVGDKTLAFWLMDKEMYWHMKQGEHHPVIERGLALHKMIRLITIALGGEGWLNFMGNEFGHPEWVDFPREGNNWSYQHCRRQWSLLDDEELRYSELAAFDRAMIAMAHECALLEQPPAVRVHLHNDDKVLIAERGDLLLAFNFSGQQSYSDYLINVPRSGVYRVILDSDMKCFGGHGRLDHSVVHHTLCKNPKLHLYLPSRTALVLDREDPLERGR
jgi:1,4-alpha-glucan branching enzyme